MKGLTILAGTLSMAARIAPYVRSVSDQYKQAEARLGTLEERLMKTLGKFADASPDERRRFTVEFQARFTQKNPIVAGLATHLNTDMEPFFRFLKICLPVSEDMLEFIEEYDFKKSLSIVS